MDWVEESKRIFKVKKPEHFTNYMHCEECAEHDEILCNSDIENIGMEQLGNPAWDPMCFCSVEGKKYYMPSLIRLCLETLETHESYLAQFLFHLEANGVGGELVSTCSAYEREFMAFFIGHLIENYASEIEGNVCTDDILRIHEIWTKA